MEEIQPVAEAPAEVAPTESARPTNRHLAIAGAATLVVLVAAGFISGAIPHYANALFGSSLADAKDTCAGKSLFVLVGDGGGSLTMQTLGKKTAGASFAEMECVFSELDMTDAIRSEVGTTRALDGRQTADWDGYHASWTYHPSDGLHMVITED